MTRRTTTCPFCQRIVTVRVNGKLWQHQQWTGGTMQFPPACPGSGKTLTELCSAEVKS